MLHVLSHGSTENVINLEVQADEEIFEGSLERLCGRLSRLAVFAYGPVGKPVSIEAHADEEIIEDLSEIGIVGGLFETTVTSIVEVGDELLGKASTKFLG